MNSPFVSCIMPTANRPRFLVKAIDDFIQQDYPNCELVIIDDGKVSSASLIPDHPTINYYYSPLPSTIGTKRNLACEKSKGEIIMHWDDDDWHALDWISRQVNALESSKADISGLKVVQFYSYALNQKYTYMRNNEDEYWMCGGTLAFKKALWDKYKFKNMQIGEDTDFITNSGGKIFVFDYLDGFLAGIHPDNTSIKYLDKADWKTYLSS